MTCFRIFYHTLAKVYSFILGSKIKKYLVTKPHHRPTHSAVSVQPIAYHTDWPPPSLYPFLLVVLTKRPVTLRCFPTTVRLGDFPVLTPAGLNLAFPRRFLATHLPLGFLDWTVPGFYLTSTVGRCCRSTLGGGLVGSASAVTGLGSPIL